jgi:hypothetical protein
MRALPSLHTLGIQLLAQRKGKAMVPRPWKWKLLLLFWIMSALLSLGCLEAAGVVQGPRQTDVRAWFLSGLARLGPHLGKTLPPSAYYKP